MPSLMATLLRWRTHSARTKGVKRQAIATPPVHHTDIAQIKFCAEPFCEDDIDAGL
jgi:hypothetical protein